MNPLSRCSILEPARWAAAWLFVSSIAAAAEPDVSYLRDIQPVLSDACYRCHGPDAGSRESGLRLDVRAETLKPADSGRRAIVPGAALESELVRRILSDDPDEQMPPPTARRQLTGAEKTRLKEWIAAGAPFDRHWSFAPIRRPPVPAVRNREWCRTPIDHFVLARLEQGGLPANGPAPPTTLLRRISFGLTGLPPRPEEIASLLGAAEGVDRDRRLTEAIDRRLASVPYGEHWARHWMDLARYADSAGYELDYPFEHSWHYRDWLIRSFQENKPLDRFLQEQLAGDQLWPESEDARTGTLFLAIGPRRFEGGLQAKDERAYEWLTDLADTTASAMLGLTMGCARCHDHKFDAITQRDYFGLQAIFAESRIEETRLGEKKSDTSPASLRVIARDKPLVVQLLRRGEPEHPLGPVEAALPSALSAEGPLAETMGSRRTALARWLTSAEHPLTARVLANRIWMWHFGKGLVRTPNDFGRQGERPTDPELLDWLASELVASGWDLNHLHRLILNSAVYRQSSTADPAIEQQDPDHRLLTRFPRRRLQAEELQDSLRLVAGRLNLEAFGPPVVPPLEPWALAGLRNANWQPTTADGAAQRRGVYMVVRRSMKLPFFDAFNGPDTVNSCAARDSTTTPLQALTLFHSAETLANAEALAADLWLTSRHDPQQAATLAWPRIFGRPIRDTEREAAREFLVSGPSAADAAAVPETWVAWTLILLNSSEFCYVD